MKQKERTREEIIFELAKYSHPNWYHHLLAWKTVALRALLEYYENDKPAGEMEVILWRWPTGFRVDEVKGEPLKNKMRFEAKSGK